jgi:hypothetical protein
LGEEEKKMTYKTIIENKDVFIVLVFLVIMFREPIGKMIPEIIRAKLRIAKQPEPEPTHVCKAICLPEEFWRDGEVKDMCAHQMPIDEDAYAKLILDTIEACRSSYKRLTFNFTETEAISRRAMNGWKIAWKDLREKNHVLLHFVYPNEKEDSVKELWQMMVDSLKEKHSSFIKVRENRRANNA